jgi:hypothetical protein
MLPTPQSRRADGLAPGGSMQGVSVGTEVGEMEMIEIPRFKKKELNFGIVRRGGIGKRIAWVGLVGAWIGNALLGMVSPLYRTPTSYQAVDRNLTR